MTKRSETEGQLDSARKDLLSGRKKFDTQDVPNTTILPGVNDKKQSALRLAFQTPKK